MAVHWALLILKVALRAVYLAEMMVGMRDGCLLKGSLMAGC